MATKDLYPGKSKHDGRRNFGKFAVIAMLRRTLSPYTTHSTYAIFIQRYFILRGRIVYAKVDVNQNANDFTAGSGGDFPKPCIA